MTVESLTLGPAGVAHRERDGSLRNDGPPELPALALAREVSPRTVRAIVAGIRGTFYRHLRAGEPEQLPSLVEALVDWALALPGARRQVVGGRGGGERQILGEAAGGHRHPARLARAARQRAQPRRASQRERIVRAAALVGVEKGYEALSIPSISRAAGVSNQTFYDHFPGKREAFLAAFDALAAETLPRGQGRPRPSGTGPEALGAGSGRCSSASPATDLFARLAFFELPTAGPAALDRAETTLDSFRTFFDPGGTVDDVVEAARHTILTRSSAASGRSSSTRSPTAARTAFPRSRLSSSSSRCRHSESPVSATATALGEPSRRARSPRAGGPCGRSRPGRDP